MKTSSLETVVYAMWTCEYNHKLCEYVKCKKLKKVVKIYKYWNSKKKNYTK